MALKRIDAARNGKSHPPRARNLSGLRAALTRLITEHNERKARETALEARLGANVRGRIEAFMRAAESGDDPRARRELLALLKFFPRKRFVDPDGRRGSLSHMPDISRP